MNEILNDQAGVHKIYLIYDLSGEPAGYVGYAWRTVKSRLRGHLRAAQRGEQFHISRALRKLHYKVGVKLLEVVSNDVSWQDAEKKWIKYYKEIGWHLWNMTLGGEGTAGRRASEKQKRAASRSMKAYLTAHVHPSKGKPSPRRGVKFTEQHRLNLSLAHRGFHQPLLVRKKISQSSARIWLGKHLSSETRDRISTSLKQRNQLFGSASTGTKRSMKLRTHLSRLKKEYYKTHSHPMQGHHHTLETRAMLRAAALKQPRSQGKFT